MPSLVIDNVPPRLFDRIQRLALAQERTPSEMALEVLETALKGATLAPRPPGELHLTDEVPAPFDIPRPAGARVAANWISDYVPEPHDVPDDG